MPVRDAAAPDAVPALVARLAERLRVSPPDPADPPWRGEPDGLLADLDGQGTRPAAVLVPIVLRDAEPTILLTRRSSSLRQHSGQIAFPGGAVDTGDSGPAAAALREAAEEIGLAVSHVRILGYLDAHLSVSGFRITPVVATVAAFSRFIPDPREVDAVFEAPLVFLLDPANHRREHLMRNGRRRDFYVVDYGEWRIWGVTAGIIRALSERIES